MTEHNEANATGPSTDQEKSLVAALVEQISPLFKVCTNTIAPFGKAYVEVDTPKIAALLDSALSKAIQSAKAEMRERCAIVCDEWSASVWDSFRDQAWAVKDRAAAIRALPLEKPTKHVNLFGQDREVFED